MSCKALVRAFFLSAGLSFVVACATPTHQGGPAWRSALVLAQEASTMPTPARNDKLNELYESVAALEASPGHPAAPRALVQILSRLLSNDDAGTVHVSCSTLGLMGTEARESTSAIRAALSEAERGDEASGPGGPEVARAPLLRRCLASVTGQAPPMRPAE